MREKRFKSYFVLRTYICMSVVSFVSCLTVGKCENSGTFQQLLDVSLPTCTKECLRRQRCEVLMYREGLNYCALKDNISIPTIEVHHPVCEYYTSDDWSHIDIGPCQGHTCDVTERCNGETGDAFECLKTECPRPGTITNTTLLSTTHTIGTTNGYKCVDGFVGHGIPTITCGNDATWSQTNFWCIQPCPPPQKYHDNAVLINVEGSLYTIGDELTYICREGYRLMGNELKGTCDENLQWVFTAGVKCCPENTTHLVDNQCIVIVDSHRGGPANYEEVVNACDELGGKFMWPSWKMKLLFNQTLTDYILMNFNMSDIETTRWNYMSCAYQNGVIGDDSQSLREKLRESNSNDWEYCWWGYVFAPGQPGLDPTEECLIRTTYGSPSDDVHDYPCVFGTSDKIGYACLIQTP